jgi:hypothetical protein
MPQIVKAGRTAAAIEHGGGQTQLLPVANERHGTVTVVRNWSSVAPNNGAIGLRWQAMMPAQFHVSSEFLGDGMAERNQPRLMEFCFFNAQEVFRGIEMPQS